MTAIADVEQVTLAEGLHRVLAGPVYSSLDVPPHANSSMDGYAIKLEDWSNGSGQCLRVSQRIPAGSIGVALAERSVARIFTGAPIPENADAVVMQELCTKELCEDGEYISISQLPLSGDNIRERGEDIGKNARVLGAGHQLRAQDVGLLASIGVTSLRVVRKLRVAVFFTGDEIIDPGQELQPGQIYNSNRYTLAAILNRLGCEVIDLGSVKDSLESTIEAFEKASKAADLIMTSGGVSVGEEDHIRPAVEVMGDLAIWRVSIKPGKPLAFGDINGVPFLGLPGNPVSVFATACVLARPYIKALQGMAFSPVKGFSVRAGFKLSYVAQRCEYLRVRCVDQDGGQVLDLYSNQSSGVLTSASWADGFAVVNKGKRVEAGDELEFIPFELFDL